MRPPSTFLNRRLRPAPIHRKLHNNLGVAYVHRERYVDALESFKKAMDEPRAYNNLGVALLGMGNPKVAAVCFEKAIELNPQYYEKATENLRQARQALAQSPNSHTTLTSQRKQSLVPDAKRKSAARSRNFRSFSRRSLFNPYTTPATLTLAGDQPSQLHQMVK